MSLLDEISQNSRGKIFLINLHYDLTRADYPLDKGTIKVIWAQVKKCKTTKITATEALFSTLHKPSNRHFRYKRPPPDQLTVDYDLQTTTTPHDMLFNSDKAIINLDLFESRYGVRDETTPWEDDDCSSFSKLFADQDMLNGKPYAHKFDIFWATTGSNVHTMSAQNARDKIGLVHLSMGTPLIVIDFQCSAKLNTKKSAPSAIEATTHTRFKSRTLTPTAKGLGRAVDLAKMAKTNMIADGLTEIVHSSIPATTIKNGHYIGRTTVETDILAGAHTSSDEAYCEALLKESITLKNIILTLKHILEPTT